MGFIESGEMSVARILVSLNIREGLREFLNLTDLGRTRVQILDYEGVPFRCRRCHEYGHVFMDCQNSCRGAIAVDPPCEQALTRGVRRKLEPISPSSVSASVGTPTCDPVESPNLLVDGSSCSGGG
jgi:hypothetical protein